MNPVATVAVNSLKFIKIFVTQFSDGREIIIAIMTKKETIRRDVEETVNQPGEVFSCLFAVMNSGKVWCCIKW